MAKKNPFDKLMAQRGGDGSAPQKGGEKGFMKAFKNAKKKSGKKRCK